MIFMTVVASKWALNALFDTEWVLWSQLSCFEIKIKDSPVDGNMFASSIELLVEIILENLVDQWRSPKKENVYLNTKKTENVHSSFEFKLFD